MRRINHTREIRDFVCNERAAGRTLAFVATMGALHEGHISLIKLARQTSDSVVVSIFVNPTQFNSPTDLERYPRTLEKDAALLERFGVAALFAPEPGEIYGNNFQTWSTNERLSAHWEGASRPGHFRGVVTVVNILFNIISPDYTIFGEKDFQQLRIVEQLVEDLRLPIKVLRGEISREPGGLARSSRNERLSASGRTRACALSRALFIARDAFRGGERQAQRLLALANEALASEREIAVDYLALVDERNLEPIAGEVQTPARIMVAAEVDAVRLLDNVGLTP